MDLDSLLEIAGIDCDQETVDDILSYHKPRCLAKIANQCYYYGSISIPVINKNSLNFACAGDSPRAIRYLLGQDCKPDRHTLEIICANNSRRALIIIMGEFPGIFKEIRADILGQLYDFGYTRIASILIKQCEMSPELACTICMRGEVTSIVPYLGLLSKIQRKKIVLARVPRGDWIIARQAYDTSLHIKPEKMLVACCRSNPASIPWLIGIGAKMNYKQWLPFRLLCVYNPDFAIDFLSDRPTYSGPSIHTIWRENGEVKTRISSRNRNVGLINTTVCNYEAYRLAVEFGHIELAERLSEIDNGVQ